MDGTGEWLPLREAAQRWGLSEKSVRRRLQAGAVQGRKVESPTGLRWEVWVGAADPAPSMVGAPSRAPSTPPAAGLVEALQLIERQQQQLLELTARLAVAEAALVHERAPRALTAPDPPRPPPRGRSGPGGGGRWAGWAPRRCGGGPLGSG
jgi:hypothetical protein